MDLFQQYVPKSSEGLLFNLCTWPDHEVFEYLLSAGIFIFIASKIIKLKKENDSKIIP